MISYYELLGLIKEDKQPKKIKFNNIVYVWSEDYYYNGEEHEIFEDIFSKRIATVFGSFEKCIEIIEDKPKKIEKLNIEIENETTGNAFIRNEHGTKCFLTKHSKIIAEKVNELIDRTDYLLEGDKYE